MSVRKLTSMTLNYFGKYQEHTKQNLPYNLAKCIIAFLSDNQKMNERLSEIKMWLLLCSYPLEIIEKAISRTELEGAAPKKEDNYSFCIYTL